MPLLRQPHIQSYQVIYDSGTVQTEVTHHGYAGGSRGTSQSTLARHCAPPRAPSPMGFVCAYAFGAWGLYHCFFGSWHVHWSELPIPLGALAVGYVLWRMWRFMAREYTADKRRWADTWYCHGCGQSHVVN